MLGGFSKDPDRLDEEQVEAYWFHIFELMFYSVLLPENGLA